MFFKTKDIFWKHINISDKIYFLVILFFISGITTGAYTEVLISTSQKSAILNYFNQFFNVLMKSDIQNIAVFKQSIINNFQLLLLFLFLGIIIIGIPIVLLLSALKGMMLGFVVAFFVEKFKWKGVLFALGNIIPQYLIFVPCIILSAAVSINFSVNIIHKILDKGYSSRVNLSKELLAYILVFIIIGIFLFIGILIESFISPMLIKSMSKYII